MPTWRSAHAGEAAIPLGFVAVSLAGTAAAFVWSPLVAWVALPPFATTLSFPIRLITYSFVAPGFGNWFRACGAIVFMTLMAGGGLKARDYAVALGSGAIVGGLTFVAVGPSGLLIGPTLATWGLVGFSCVYAVRNWRWLSLVARMYAALVCLGGVAALTGSAGGPSSMAVVVAAAFLGPLVIAVVSGAGRPSATKEGAGHGRGR